jgi:hypothetical protein
VDPANLKSILFQQCTNIPNDIGHILHEDNFSLKNYNSMTVPL